MEKIKNHIVSWLKDYVTNAKVEGFVVGISGGIDSAVVSTLCAYTGLKVLCVEMPIHQAISQVNRAKEHIDFLQNNFSNVERVEVDLTETFEKMKSVVPTSDNDALLQLTLANTRARLRMTTLYYLGGINRLLVAGTGNKVEDFGVGFFTKYGDGGVDISPIADLMKSDVRKLAAYLDVPVSIQQAAPTDGLFGDDRTDEDQLGASYDELEKAMIAYENGAKADDFSGREREVFEIFSRLHHINQHKMNPIPICVIPLDLK
ncbi:NAD(+) synthase [Capnocytophaga sp. ARDL2]|uniref:NAD(+) synthase n=1 Tax=Capnocytophaga sp. ARDL2 TaxID=3238809 RepID=UPI0035592774